MADALGARPTITGESVTVDKAMTVPAYLGGVKVIAESTALIPLPLYRRLEQGRERASDHPVYSLLHRQANDWTSAYEFREAMTVAAVNHGDGFALVGRAGGQPKELVQIPSQNVEVKANTFGEPIYSVSDGKGGKRDYSHRDVFHLRGFGSKILQGDSTCHSIRNAIAVALCAEEFTGTNLRRGLRPSGWLKTGTKLSPDAIEKLRKGLDKNYGGAANAGRPMVLESGLEWVEAQQSSADAQLIELRKFAIAEISRALRVPMHLLGDMERATFSNVEEMGQQFITYTLAPWLARWESAVSRTLLGKDERESLYAEHLIDALVKADIGKRFQAYAVALGRAGEPGFMTRDEIRERENLAPRPDSDFPNHQNNGGPANERPE